ncbi:hypothetical protein OT109_18530 [Phycisphaeraceae bacterium D3-23]
MLWVHGRAGLIERDVPAARDTGDGDRGDGVAGRADLDLIIANFG